MSRIDNTTFYQRAIERHGYNAQGVHWNSEQSQVTRFEVIASMLPAPLDHCALVDVGCGFGDFYCYLKQHRQLPQHYRGLDCMAPMVEEAINRTGQSILTCDVLKDPLYRADYYVCSGAMNILTPFETHLFITRCFEHSKRGFIFNLLEGRDDSMVYNYVNPHDITALGQQLGARVDIKRGYLERDFTAAFYRPSTGVA